MDATLAIAEKRRLWAKYSVIGLFVALAVGLVTVGLGREADAAILLTAPVPVTSSEWIAGEAETFRVDRASNTVQVGDGFMWSPSGQTLWKVGGMAASFGFNHTYEPLVASDTGQVAFAEPFAAGRSIYSPGGRSTSDLVIVDVGTGSETQSMRRYEFKANIVPEAFTADGSGLFVIDHRPALDPTAYRVRLLDLATGELNDVGPPQDSGSASLSGGRPKLPPLEDMVGSGRRQVGTSSGEYLFTLYSRQPAHHDGSTHDDHVHGFVHALSLRGGWAICIDLPPEFGRGQIGTGAIAVDPEGSVFFVVDSRAGAIVSFDVDDLTPKKLLKDGLPQPHGVRAVGLDADADAPVSAVATADSLWIGQGTRLLVLPHNLADSREYRTEAAIDALVVDGGGRLFAIVADQLIPLPSSPSAKN